MPRSSWALPSAVNTQFPDLKDNGGPLFASPPRSALVGYQALSFFPPTFSHSQASLGGGGNEVGMGARAGGTGQGFLRLPTALQTRAEETGSKRARHLIWMEAMGSNGAMRQVRS